MEESSALKWVVLLVLIAACLASSIYLYRRRETPGRGRLLLALLRGGTLALLILLLFNPSLPTAARSATAAGTVIVLDGSLSMGLPTTAGRTRWNEALERVGRVNDVSTVLLMGGTARRIPRDSLGRVSPTAGDSRLLPALQAASESGAHKVVVITDGAIEDAQEVQRWLPRLGLELEVQTVGQTHPADRALTEVSAPAWVEAGKPIEVAVGVTGTGEVPTPPRVAVRAAGTELGAVTLVAPGPGRVSTGTLSVTPPAPQAGGLVRLDVALEGQDAVSANNVRSVYVLVGAKPTTIALVSLEPDWEPRFLQPVLEQTLGLPVRSFFRTTGGTFITGGVGTDVGKRLGESDVRTAIADADLIVLHGVAAGAPAWVNEAIQSRPRVLVLPAERGAPLPGLEIPAATPADWFVTAEIPASPVAGLMAGVPVENLPPLTGLHLPRALPSGSWVPLQAARGRRGSGAPIAVAFTEQGRRRVVGLGQGYWKWSFRGGEQRQVYSRFWGALAGWLVQEQAQIAGGAVRPARRVVQQGQRIIWVASGLAADSVQLRIIPESGEPTLLTIPTESSDSSSSAPLPPGNYRYEARAFAGGSEAGTGAGPFTVEAYSDELSRPARPLAALTGAAASVLDGISRGGARPLRTTIWPYALLIGLLALEWVLRRRWGLR